MLSGMLSCKFSIVKNAMNAAPTMTKLSLYFSIFVMRKKFQRFKILKIKNFNNRKFQRLRISISKKKVARSDFREFQMHPPRFTSL